MRRRCLLVTGLTVATSTAIAGCSDGPGEDLPEPPARVAESELVRSEVGTPDETVAVEGVLERTRDEEISYLEVRAEFYDDEDEQLDSTVEQVSSVQDGGDSWPFRVVFPHVGERAAAVVSHHAEVVRNPWDTSGSTDSDQDDSSGSSE